MKITGHGWDREDFDKRFWPVIREMMEDRGWIINCFAQIEFLTGDIAVKARQFPEYKELLSKPVHFGIDKRVKCLRQLCEFGPIAAHADNILPLLDQILEMEETRHFFTHGFMSIHVHEGGEIVAMHLRRYVQPKKGELETRSELLVLPDQIARERGRAIIFSQTANEIFRNVYANLGLQFDDVTDGSPKLMQS